MRSLKMILPLFCIALLFACGDDTAPQITITSPSDGSTYSSGDVINFAGTVTDDTGVQSVQVTNSDFGISQSETYPEGTLGVDLTFTLTLADNTEAKEYEIVFSATDVDGEKDEKKVKIKVE